MSAALLRDMGYTVLGVTMIMHGGPGAEAAAKAAAGSASLTVPFTDAEGRLLGRHKGIFG